MRDEEVFANIELWLKLKSVNVHALVDTGATRSIMSMRLAKELDFVPYEKTREIGTAEEGGKLRLVGYCVVEKVVFEGVEIPIGASLFEVAENLRGEVDLILGRDNIDLWNVKVEKGKIPYVELDPLHFLIV